MEPWEQRLIEEKRDLDEKITKLNAFIVGRGSANSILLAQLATMSHYSMILGLRISGVGKER